MNINKEIAQKIVIRTMKIIPYSVNVMDQNGIIIASGNPSRLNQKHTGAVLAIRENRVIEITSELAKLWNYEAREGINLPITYQGKILGVVGISGMPSEVKPFAELVKMTAELITEQAILLEQERWRHRYKEEFFLTIIKTATLSNELLIKAKEFGINFDENFVCILLKLQEGNEENIQHLFIYLEQYYPSKMTVITALNQIAILQAIPTNQNFSLPTQFVNRLPVKAKIAIGGIFSGKQALYYAYSTAFSTLEYGIKKSPNKALYLFEDYKLPALLEQYFDSWQCQELLRPLQVLTEDKYTNLVKTLEKYFSSNCDLTLTSESLFIHQNSLRYRLQKIEEITHLSFNKIAEKFILYLFSLQQKKLEKPTKITK
ncbi:sugar diacid recognition domain-containing protein [Gallibacterium melopsittaci]|uniref:Sugar diacid recognition domain-containing protein n=1 Tax=Gallibacterium melopsittaci TaxID=516063 RepID=A0ABV6HSW5_9PAST